MTTTDNKTTLQPTRTTTHRQVTIKHSTLTNLNTSRDSPTTGAVDITSLIMTSLVTSEQSTRSRKHTQTSTSQPQTADNRETVGHTARTSTSEPIHTADTRDTDRYTTGSSASQPRQTTKDRETVTQNNQTTSQPSTHQLSTIFTTSEKSATSHQGK